MDNQAFEEMELISSYSVDQAVEDGALIAVDGDDGEYMHVGDMFAIERAMNLPDGDEPEPAVRPLSSRSDRWTSIYRALASILGKKAVTSLRPLHVPNRDPLPDMEDLCREPFAVPTARDRGWRTASQRRTVLGLCAARWERARRLLAMTAVYKHAQQARSKGGSNGNFRCLILCPDHLIAKWKREIEETIPDAKVYYFGTLSRDEAKARKKDDGKSGQVPAINDLINLLDKRDGNRWSKPDGAEYYVIGRNQVKWYPEWAGISDPYKGLNTVGGNLAGVSEVIQIGTDGDGQPVTKRVFTPGGVGEAMTVKPTTVKSIVVDRVKAVGPDGQEIKDADGRVKMKSVTAQVFTCPKCGNVIRDRKGIAVSGNALSKNKMTCEGKYLQQIPTIDRHKTEHGLDVISPLPEKFKDRTTGVVSIGTNKYKVMTCGEPLWWFTSKPYRYSLARIIQRKFRRFFKYLIIDEAHEQQSDEAAQSMAAGKLIGSTDHVLALTGTLIGGYAKNLYALLLRVCPQTLRAEHFEWGKDMEFSKVYGRIDRIVTTKEEAGAAKPGVGKNCASMRRAKTGNSTERPGRQAGHHAHAVRSAHDRQHHVHHARRDGRGFAGHVRVHRWRVPAAARADRGRRA